MSRRRDFSLYHLPGWTIPPWLSPVQVTAANAALVYQRSRDLFAAIWLLRLEHPSLTCDEAADYIIAAVQELDSP